MKTKKVDPPDFFAMYDVYHVIFSFKNYSWPFMTHWPWPAQVLFMRLFLRSKNRFDKLKFRSHCLIPKKMIYGARYKFRYKMYLKEGGFYRKHKFYFIFEQFRIKSKLKTQNKASVRMKQMMHLFMTIMESMIIKNTVQLFIILTKSKNKKMTNDTLLQLFNLGSVLFCLAIRRSKLRRTILICQQFIIHITRNT